MSEHASQVNICNLALIKIGAERITSITQNTRAAIALNERWACARDSLQRSHLWNFNTERVELAQDATPPVSGFLYRFPLPNDWLRTENVTRSTDDNDTAIYRIEGRYILSDEPELFLKYGKSETDVNQWDQLFCDAMALTLASEICYLITQNSEKEKAIQQELKETLREARGVDAQEDFTEQPLDDEWILARR